MVGLLALHLYVLEAAVEGEKLNTDAVKYTTLSVKNLTESTEFSSPPRPGLAGYAVYIYSYMMMMMMIPYVSSSCMIFLHMYSILGNNNACRVVEGKENQSCACMHASHTIMSIR